MSSRDKSVTQKLLKDFCQEPTETTFQPLYENTKNLVYTLCYRILRNEEDAADAFQSTYCRVLALARRAGGRKEDREAPETIYRLAVREAQSLRQRRARRAKKEVAMRSPSFPDAQPRPDEMVANRQLRERVEALVSILSDRYRVPLLLHYVHGLTYPEIAEVLEKPIGTISTHIGRALKKLDPAMRRAGLGQSAKVLGAIGVTVHLLSPPDSLDASLVFSEAKAALTRRAAATGAATAAGTIGSFVAKIIVGVGVMKTRTAGIAAVIALGTVGLIVTLGLMQSNREPVQRADHSRSNPCNRFRDSGWETPDSGHRCGQPGTTGDRAGTPR